MRSRSCHHLDGTAGKPETHHPQARQTRPVNERIGAGYNDVAGFERIVVFI